MPFQKGNTASYLRKNLLRGASCIVSECSSPAYCKKLCIKHYARFRKHGDPLEVKPPRMSNRSIVVLENGCHVFDTFLGVRPKKRIGNKLFLVARIALEKKLGRPLADEMCALHSCDNPPCVNPDHLFEGTRQDNNADRDIKRRHWAHKRRDGITLF